MAFNASEMASGRWRGKEEGNLITGWEKQVKDLERIDAGSRQRTGGLGKPKNQCGDGTRTGSGCGL